LNSVFSDIELEEEETPEYSLPTCYYLSKPMLKLSHIKKFSEFTLFYVFYNMPGEKLQALAAEDLYRRDWLYEPFR